MGSTPTAGTKKSENIVLGFFYPSYSLGISSRRSRVYYPKLNDIHAFGVICLSFVSNEYFTKLLYKTIFFHILLIFAVCGDIIILPNESNNYQGYFSFRDSISFFEHPIVVGFGKIANSKR